ncbi:OLC1v1008564C1 [Oldenlandia corymbosa var. corymbosa]|uniref:OLC1v1008564C1 n=1 Tax=Oldenlandia corymbosa var. corymbosa TaxID=529605 RepID=A0AAV1DMA2_OLDCO|nr:OLC1v1008564C1 [Oldenlandia corymbosa var. corymbosa]
MDSPKNSHVSDAVRAIPSASQSDSPGTSSWPGSLGGPNSWSPRKSRPVNRTSATASYTLKEETTSWSEADFTASCSAGQSSQVPGVQESVQSYDSANLFPLSSEGNLTTCCIFQPFFYALLFAYVHHY